MDRCELANAYHEKGYNCAQSVLAAFGDLTGLPERDALAAAGGLGGGVGGSHQEICGAASGAVMALGLLNPHVQENCPDAKRRVYERTKDFLDRFQARFGCTRCGDLLRAKVEPTGRAAELGLSRHCALLVVGAVEILEEMLGEQGAAV